MEFAINSLEKTDFDSYNLSTSFRFSQPIADLAKGALRLKKFIDREHEVTIVGKGQSEVRESRAVLGRSNVALLLKAIDLLSKNKIKHIYFEGNFNSYTYADEGASLYDVLNLYNGKRYLIKDQLIKAMKDMKELEDYIEKTEDNQLGMMVEIVLEYGNEIPKIIQSIKDKHVEDDEPEKAEIIFSTIHRCKGLEYDDVYLVEDFIIEEKLKQILTEKKDEEINREKLNEEINLLYVAMTRARNKVHVPESFVLSNFPASPHIHILKETDARENYRSMFSKEKSQGSSPLQT
jgi:F-box protein 18 (helicase)